MRILALDSSGLTASVAVVEDEQILFEYTMNYKKTHSQTLLPMLDEAVRMTGLSLDTVDAIGRGTGILYRAADWICDGKRTGTRP